MATSSRTPALIDPPYFGSLQDWVDYRDSLAQSGIPNIRPFIQQANRMIARRRRKSATEGGGDG